MPTLLEIEDLRSELFAEDIPIHDAMLRWTLMEASAYFESGGQVVPATNTASQNQTEVLCLHQELQSPPHLQREQAIWTAR